MRTITDHKRETSMRNVLIFVFCLAPMLASADPAGIEVQHAWSRAMPAGGNGVVYLTISDHAAADTLTGASSPVAAKAELHESMDDHGVMKMRGVASLSIEPNKPVTFAPDGYHIMLIGLKHALVAGTTFPVTLNFTHAGKVTTMASVEKLGAAMPDMSHGSMGGAPMGGMNMK